MKKYQITQRDINQFYTDRKGAGDHVIIEGLHAYKHAYRFGAVFDVLYIIDKEKTLECVKGYAGDQEALFLAENAQEVSATDFCQLAPHQIRTGIIARAHKPAENDQDLLTGRPIVVLEDPRDLDNVGAVIRTCAARGIAAVVTTGTSNPWHVNALRGAAGLHFAQPVFARNSIEEIQSLYPARPLVVCSDEGTSMYTTPLADDSIFVFGTERGGVQDTTKKQAECIISIPMQKGVSSMNLATSVSAVLFGVQ